MNKKGQMPSPYPQQERLGAGGEVSPLLILGIVIFVVPFFGPIIKINFPGWVGTIGIIIIIIGLIHSILKASGVM